MLAIPALGIPADVVAKNVGRRIQAYGLVQGFIAAYAVLSFGAGWSWPALFNLAIVRANPLAAAQATGVTQTGTYIGVFSGPITMGQVVERWGYTVGWSMVAVSMLIGASIMFAVAPHFRSPG